MSAEIIALRAWAQEHGQQPHAARYLDKLWPVGDVPDAQSFLTLEAIQRLRARIETEKANG